MNALRERIEGWLKSGTRVGIARVVETKGSSPCAAGALMAVNERSEIAGSIGLDCVEGALVELARRTLREGRAIEAAFDASGDELGDVTLPCGGAIRVHVAEAVQDDLDELFAAQPAMRVIIAGANDYARALLQLCALAGYEAVVADARPAFANAGVVQAWPDEFLAASHIDFATAIVLLSHDTRYDAAFLLHALRSRAFYVGAIGSRRTQQRRRERLADAGATADDLARLHAPIGLDIGAQTAFEVAVSIFAEIVAVRSGHAGEPLKDSQGPIHGPRPETATARA